VHKSKLAGFIIDCDTDDLGSAAEFWSHALGMERRALPAPEGDKYVRLVDPTGAIDVEVQKVDHPSRVHLDIETDDVEAEVSRLEKLGARVKARIRNHVVMVAPSGHAFCVVPVYRGDFPAKAAEWSGKP
jgi:predicted enzyme related to lactoylglutathione lyase